MHHSSNFVLLFLLPYCQRTCWSGELLSTEQINNVVLINELFRAGGCCLFVFLIWAILNVTFLIVNYCSDCQLSLLNMYIAVVSLVWLVSLESDPRKKSRLCYPSRRAWPGVSVSPIVQSISNLCQAFCSSFFRKCPVDMNKQIRKIWYQK